LLLSLLHAAAPTTVEPISVNVSVRKSFLVRSFFVLICVAPYCDTVAACLLLRSCSLAFVTLCTRRRCATEWIPRIGVPFRGRPRRGSDAGDDDRAGDQVNRRTTTARLRARSSRGRRPAAGRPRRRVRRSPAPRRAAPARSARCPRADTP